MKPLKPLLAVTSIIFFSMTAANCVADNSSHVQQVQTLFKLTQMEKKVNESIDSILQIQLSQNPQLTQREPEMRAFFERQIGWDALKDDVTQMYLRTFSEKELIAINDFYITPVGQKVITALPGLVDERNQLAMTRLQENIVELQQIMGVPTAK